MSSEPLLEIIDDFAPAELFAEACKVGAAKGWYFGHGSHDHDTGRFWKMDLEGIKVFDAIWQHAQKRCEKMVGAPIRVLRQYANGHTYGLGGQPHLDDHRPGSYTLLYYPMAEWKDGWDGETVFFDEHGEIALSVRPRPNRAVIFDSRILHAGRAPSRSCPDLRVTVAYKLQVAVSEVREPKAEERPAGIPPALPMTTAETSRDGALREYIVRIPEDRIRQLVHEKLTKLGETVRLPGFRPGKIPAAVLEQRYGASTRSEILKELITDAAAKTPPEGSVVASVDVQQDAGGAEFKLTTVYLPDLAEPDLSQLTLERLSASDSDLASSGLEREALAGHVKQQMLDHLDRSYAFPLPGTAVEREFAAIWQAAKSQGSATDADAAEFRRIAERRIRLGIVVAELARRYAISGSQTESLVLDRLISSARVVERVATLDDLSQL
jgi:SM-20-related protein